MTFTADNAEPKNKPGTRLRMASFLYALALLLMPFALKPMLHTWFHPTLMIGLLIFFLLKAPMNDKMALWVVVCAFLSASAGYFYMVVSPDRGEAPLYTVYIEPIRLCFYMIWFWMSAEFLSIKRSFVLRWLAISATLQLAIAVYLYLALYDLAPVPDIVGLYLSVYKLRQTVWFGDIPVYRMAGTFIESPPFGLFMFSCFVMFAIRLAKPKEVDSGAEEISGRRWARLGATVSLCGAIASMSDQVLLAVIVFGLSLYFGGLKKQKSSARRVAEAVLGSAVLIGVAAYAVPQMTEKVNEAASTSAGEMDTRRKAGAERMFHIRYGFKLLLENPLAIFTGIGPGRYGDYAVTTGQYPSDVPIQVTPVAWLVEYGLFGTMVIASWLWNITKKARAGYSVLAIGSCAGLVLANISQGGWMFDAWFLALAFLYCGIGVGPSFDLAVC